MNNLDPLGILKSDTEREVAQDIVDILKPYSPDQRAETVRELHKLLAEKDQLQSRKAEDERRLAAMDELRDWFQGKGLSTITLEKNDCSRLHRLKDAARAGKLLGNHNERLDGSDSVQGFQHTFVVRHDWAAAFEGSEGLDDSFRLPYESCAFEFRISGRNIIALAADSGSEQMFSALVEIRDYWYAYGAHENRDDPVIRFIWDQMRAISIALDAEVATHSIVRAPHKLNEKRARDGKAPVADFHIVDLAKRHRVANPGGVAGAGSSKRLHFRRGHWRHFETSKTWVRWCLVGDPDLGFIQKSYTL